MARQPSPGHPARRYERRRGAGAGVVRDAGRPGLRAPVRRDLHGRAGRGHRPHQGPHPAVDWTATLALFTAVFAAGQTAGPWLSGLVADRTSTAATLAWTAVLCTAAALIALVRALDPGDPSRTHDQPKEQDHGELRARPRNVPRWMVLRATSPDGCATSGTASTR